MSNGTHGKREPGKNPPVRITFTSTEAQNNFGQVLSRARSEGRVFITKYDRPEAVVLSIEEYDSLIGQESVDLQALDRELDEMLVRMQRPGQRHGVDALFSLTGQELGAAAVRGARDAE